MKVVFSIIDYKLGKKLIEIMIEEECHFRLTTFGNGTADSEWLELLGLGDNKKAIVISVMPKEQVTSLYRRLERDMKLTRAGMGISFSVPVSAMSGAITKICEAQFKEFRGLKKDMENIPDSNETHKYELIITIVNRGCFENVKNAAKAEGARGGTLIHGLGIGGDEAAKFLGISIQPEKDIVLIVVHKDDSKTIMNRIAKEAGIATESKGICFSLPVDSALGLASKIEY